MFNFSNYFTVIQMPSFAGEIASIATEEFIGIKPKIYLILMRNSIEFLKSKSHMDITMFC